MVIRKASVKISPKKQADVNLKARDALRQSPDAKRNGVRHHVTGAPDSEAGGARYRMLDHTQY